MRPPRYCIRTPVDAPLAGAKDVGRYDGVLGGKDLQVNAFSHCDESDNIPRTIRGNHLNPCNLSPYFSHLFIN